MASLPQWPYFTYPPAEARKANPLRLGGALLAERGGRPKRVCSAVWS